ncbi:MAG: hypothetical protein L0211_24925 [Planctomycetaceae bacterium]|nr:hypothetical protein [Planctomycetaceae bacterium]
MADVLLFWKARPDLNLPAEAIAREINWGEEVDGLIDLPVKEIIDRLKAEFPEHDERPGSLAAKTPGGGSWEATWGWQFFRVELHDAEGDARQRLMDVLAEFGCGVVSSQ